MESQIWPSLIILFAEKLLKKRSPVDLLCWHVQAFHIGKGNDLAMLLCFSVEMRQHIGVYQGYRLCQCSCCYHGNKMLCISHDATFALLELFSLGSGELFPNGHLDLMSLDSGVLSLGILLPSPPSTKCNGRYKGWLGSQEGSQVRTWTGRNLVQENREPLFTHPRWRWP
jgi:hypothetical protein